MTSIIDFAHSGIKQLRPYQPGKPESEVKREFGLDNVVKLASNENPLGASQAAIEAIKHAAVALARYPDGAGHDLKQVLSQFHGIAPSQITLGNGTNELLNMIARLFLSNQASVVFSEHAFIIYKMTAILTGAQPIEVPAKQHGHDLGAMAAAITDTTRLVFLANPNNPTGTYFELEAFEAFMASVPSHVVVVLDEAYFDYVDKSLGFDGIALVARYSNLIVTRTFSKAYGLSALRIGYAVCSDPLADLLNRAREPFNTNTLAQAAAVAVLADRAYVEKGVSLNQTGMVQLKQGLTELGLSWIESQGNFLAVDVGDGVNVASSLLAKGMIVRPISEYGMPSYIRVTVGLSEENKAFLALLSEVLVG